MSGSDGASIAGMIGVLLAAGRGRRMGVTKQLLPWPPCQAGAESNQKSTQCTVVEAAFDSIAPFCRQVVVVVGHEAQAICGALSPRAMHTVHVQPEAEMLVSVAAGLRQAMQVGAGAVMLHLADHPAVAQKTIRALAERFNADRTKAVMPEHRGKGGHPVLIPRNYFDAILAFGKSGGLRAYWRERSEQCVRIPVSDPGVTADIDVPSDYRAG